MNTEPWTWIESDLLSLIREGTQESLTLDYKQSEALQRTDPRKNELAKDVSAFANSAGGTIIYGMKEDGHVPVGLDDGLDPDVITKEWLEQVINSRIQRRIDGIRVNQVRLSHRPDRVAYVVFIPQSTRAPHQAADKRFYKRFNFEAVPMEEYEVRDTAKRSTAPDITVKVEFKPGGDSVNLAPGENGYYMPVGLTLMVSNTSAATAEAAVLHLYFDKRIRIGTLPQDCRQTEASAMSFPIDDEIVSFSKMTILWDRTRAMPIFRGITAELPSIPIDVEIPMKPNVYVLRYEIASPGMEPKDHLVLIAAGNNTAKIEVPAQHDLKASAGAV